MYYFALMVPIVIGILLIFSTVKYKSTRKLSMFPYAPDEQQLFEEKPEKVMEVLLRGDGKHRNFFTMPFVRITNKHIIIAQKRDGNPDGIISRVLSFHDAPEVPELDRWKQGYAVIPFKTSEVSATQNSDGTYTIHINLPFDKTINTLSGNIPRIMDIVTSNFSQYEKALHTKIKVTSE